MQTLDKAIEHQVNLERYKSSISKKYALYINRLAGDVHSILSALSTTKSDINKAIVSINSLIDTTYIKIGEDYLEDVKSLLESEVVYLATGVEVVLTEEEADKIVAASLASLVLGLSIYDHLLAQRTSLKRNIRGLLVGGRSNNFSISDIARGIRGTQANRYKDGVWSSVNNKLSSITSTGVQQFSTDAKTRVWKKTGVSRYIWISVLDSRTTPICRKRSNKIYEVGNGPTPPAHYRCRSIIHPYTDGLVIPESYSQWLRRQPRATIDDILGEGKAKLFLSGKVTLDGFVTEAGRELTLQQLKRKLGSA